tara:strand:+ start:286 stop:693 length:408 start_codon:yes stop_codon:yes gene_type:complete
MVKAIARVAKELAKRKKRSMENFPKGKKGSKAVDARTSRYIKTPSGMKLNPERFKQKPLPKASKLKQTKAAKKPGFKTGVAAGAIGTVGIQKMQDKSAKAKDKRKQTQTMAAKAVEKQKQKQKEYRQKKGGKGNR